MILIIPKLVRGSGAVTPRDDNGECMELLCCACISCLDLFIFIFTKCVLLNLLIYSHISCVV
jgi:hypothetical protein